VPIAIELIAEPRMKKACSRSAGSPQARRALNQSDWLGCAAKFTEEISLPSPNQSAHWRINVFIDCRLRGATPGINHCRG
jgi:hypothetical protein